MHLIAEYSIFLAPALPAPGPPLGVHPFLNFKGAKGLKVSIWSMMEGSKKIFGFHQP